MRANRRARSAASRRGGDGGQLLLLGGIVLILAMLTSMLAVQELGSEQATILRGGASNMPDLFMQSKIKAATTLDGLSYAGVDDSTLSFNLNSTQIEVQRLTERHGAMMMLRFGNSTDAFAPINESYFVSGTNYNVVSYNGSRDFSGLAYDNVSDGIIHNDTGAVRGAVLYLMVADTSVRMSETFVVSIT